MRDARMVSEVLLGGHDWSPAAFAGYVEERAERMRRLRFSAGSSPCCAQPSAPRGWPSGGVGTNAPAMIRSCSPRSWPCWWGPEQVGADAFTDDNMEHILTGA